MAGRPSRIGFRLRRQEAVTGYDGMRECAYCGGHIDPIDWCPFCRALRSPCNRPHRTLRKRPSAAFCDDVCRGAHRNSAITNINYQARTAARHGK